MKIRFDRINRGIVLAVLLAMGTSGYVVWQNVSFKNNTPTIAKRSEELLREMAETNIGSDTDAVRRKQIAFVQNNFSSEKTGASVSLMGMNLNKGSILYQLNENMGGDYMDSEDDDWEIYSAEYVQKSTEVKKSGTTGADVTIDYELRFVYRGDPTFLTYSGLNNYSYMYDDGDDETEKNKRRQVVLTAQANLFMLPDGKNWKIASMSSDEYEIDVVDPDEEGGESDG